MHIALYVFRDSEFQPKTWFKNSRGCTECTVDNRGDVRGLAIHVWFSNLMDHRQMVEQSEAEGRILLTKDIKLLRRRLMPENLAYFVKRNGKWEQLEEVCFVERCWLFV